MITVLADEAPDLRQALERASLSVRGEAIDLWYSGKAHAHGGNIQAVIAPDGFPLRVSEVEPGSVHDITAARIHALPALYRAVAA